MAPGRKGGGRNDTLRHAGKGEDEGGYERKLHRLCGVAGLLFFSLRRFMKPTPVEEDRNELRESPGPQHHGNISLRVTSGASDLREHSFWPASLKAAGSVEKKVRGMSKTINLLSLGGKKNHTLLALLFRVIARHRCWNKRIWTGVCGPINTQRRHHWLLYS